MEQKFLNDLYDSFTKLVEKYGFIKATELNEDGVYSIEYRSDTFVIKIEKYRREFYVALYKTGYPDKGVNLFNLLSYLNQTPSVVPESNYFREEKDLGECYKKQFNHISDTIYQNFDAINNFFKSGNYELKMIDIRKFMLSEFPELFKRT